MQRDPTLSYCANQRYFNHPDLTHPVQNMTTDTSILTRKRVGDYSR